MMDEIYLVSNLDTMQNDIGAFVSTEQTRRVLCEVGSIIRSEWVAAGQRGHRPALMVTIPVIDYAGELEAEYHGRRYSIYRTHAASDGWDTELYLEEKAGVSL